MSALPPKNTIYLALRFLPKEVSAGTRFSIPHHQMGHIAFPKKKKVLFHPKTPYNWRKKKVSAIPRFSKSQHPYYYECSPTQKHHIFGVALPPKRSKRRNPIFHTASSNGTYSVSKKKKCSSTQKHHIIGVKKK